jgi:hypothetical protein
VAKVRAATDEEKKARDWSIPAGRYVLGFSEFERKNGKDKPYADFLRVKFPTVKKDGTNGKGFRDIVGLMVDPKGVQEFEKRVKFNITRLQIWIEVFGITEEFEVGDTSEGIESAREGDRNFARLFVGRAFVAEVTRKESGGYVNNNVNRILPRSQWTPAELERVNAWEAAQLGRPKVPEDSVSDDDTATSTDDQFDNEADPLADDLPDNW